MIMKAKHLKHDKKMGPFISIKKFVINYFNFWGQSSFPEFFWSMIFVSLILYITNHYVSYPNIKHWPNVLYHFVDYFNVSGGASVAILILIIPTLSLAIRRIRDSGLKNITILICCCLTLIGRQIILYTGVASFSHVELYLLVLLITLISRILLFICLFLPSKFIHI